MQIRLEQTPWQSVQTDWLIIGVLNTELTSQQEQDVDQVLGGLIQRLRKRRDITGEEAELQVLLEVPAVQAERVLLVGLGSPAELSVAGLESALTAAARKTAREKEQRVALLLPELPEGSVDRQTVAELAARAFTIGCVGEDLFKREPDLFPFKEVVLLTAEAPDSLKAAVQKGQIVGEAINLVRELVNRPPSEVFPASFADRAAQVASELGLKCDVLDENRLREERMNAMLAVGAGSERPPRLVVVEYQGRGEAEAPVIALVGKGVTFDSGGLSLKTAEHMANMKTDMAGAATVLGTTLAAARLGLPVNVRAYMGMVENLPSGSSYKVGDILTARNGMTIEVVNTDAEGRLVLADVLCYAVDQGADRLVDVATLTGSCIIALGERVTGAFTNNEPWCRLVLEAAQAAGEQIWQMPMFKHYEEQLKSNVADVKNVGGRWGGAITAAKFLEKFVRGKPWVHLDIAGPVFVTDGNNLNGGATGCMVKTLIETLRRVVD